MSFLRKFMNYTFMKSKRNFRNIVIIGHNYSLLFVDFVCISMGSLFSGVLPSMNKIIGIAGTTFKPQPVS